MIMEYVGGGDLQNYIRETRGPIPYDIIKEFGFQIIKGISHMHDHHIKHQDLKPQNILISED